MLAFFFKRCEFLVKDQVLYNAFLLFSGDFDRTLQTRKNNKKKRRSHEVSYYAVSSEEQPCQISFSNSSWIRALKLEIK